MNVLFITRPDVLNKPGGDTIQLQKTKESLETLGIKVKIEKSSKEALDWADIVHIFNIQTPESSLPAMRAARSAGKKTVLSTIWWDMRHARQSDLLARVFGLPNRFWEMTIPISHAAFSLIRRDKLSQIEELLQSASMLLPNSEEEMSIIRRDFGVELPDYCVVMNAIDNNVFNSPHVILNGKPINKSVICCGRIEPLKNQLSLIEAVAGMEGVHLTLVGKMARSKRYADRVRYEMKNHNFDLIDDHLNQSDLASIMKEHCVHALPSFRESPGLSSLEALACGLAIVVSSKEFCPVETYFGSWLDSRVFQCTPYSVDSLRRALQAALEAGHRQIALPKSMTWQDVGRQTLSAYMRVIDDRR